MSTKKIVIIGNSAAGVAAIEAIRERDNASKITVISDESYSAYCRCLISNYLAGTIDENGLIYRDKKFYADNMVELLLEKKAEKVDVKKKNVVLEDKTQIPYDSLIIATGASSKMPKDLKGVSKKGVFAFRTINDARDILNLTTVSHTSCILGGGLIGLKAAYGLKKRGQDVKIIVRSGRLMSQVVDNIASSFILKRFQDNGIEVLLNSDVSEIIGNGDMKALKLDNGKVIGCSLAVIGKGVSPNVKLIKETDIKTDKGILVDEYMRTNIENVYAAGDVCQAYDLTMGKPEINALWPHAVEQGRYAGANICGDNLKYAGSFGMNSVEFFGLAIISIGIFDGDYETLSYADKDKEVYKKVVIDGDRLIGALFVGSIANSGLYTRLIKERINISGIKDDLLDENISYAKIKNLVKEEKEKIYI